MDYLDGFRNFLLVDKKVSENTLSNYLRDVVQFLNFYNKSSVPTLDDIKNYQLHLLNSGKSAATVSRVNASLRAYYNYLNKIEVVDYLPSKNGVCSQGKRSLPDVLTVKEIDLLLNAPALNDFKGLRDKAILEVFYATGIKATELIELKIENVNLDIGFIKIENKNSERIVPMYKQALKALSTYVNSVRNVISVDDDDRLFLNMSGTPLTRQGLWKIIKHYADVSGIKKEITPHILRHSFAAHLVANGAGLDDIKEMLGFADISSTRIYSEIFKNKYQKAYGRFHPMANK